MDGNAILNHEPFYLATNWVQSRDFTCHLQIVDLEGLQAAFKFCKCHGLSDLCRFAIRTIVNDASRGTCESEFSATHIFA